MTLKTLRTVKLGLSNYDSLAHWTVGIASEPTRETFKVVEVPARDLEVDFRLKAKRARLFLFKLQPLAFSPSFFKIYLLF